MERRQSLAHGWSPERKLWDELGRLSTDLSWKRVAFDPNRASRISMNQRGVYLICASPPVEAIEAINAYTVLYTGQVKSLTHGLRARFLEHIRTPSPQLKLFLECYYPAVHFWFTAVDDRSKIDDLEALLRETFNPPCNAIRAPGTQVLLARLGIGRIVDRGSKRQTT